MLGNLVNIHDIPLLIEKMRQGRFRGVLSRFFLGRGVGAVKSWDFVESPPKNWWDIPKVRERWNILISGDAEIGYCPYFLDKYFPARCSLRALTLGCGTGHRELELAGLGIFERIDAIDLSEARIRYARERSVNRGFGDIINYIAGDVYRVQVDEGSYDVVLADQSLHHFSPLGGILHRIDSFLKPEGCFIFNEFVGPSRFQWTDKQLEAVNGLLSILPEKYRVRWGSGTIKRKVHRPGRLIMLLYDPTEAVQSSEILPLVNEIFDTVEVRGYGGTVIQLLLSDIAQNFLSEDSETQRLLHLCFEREDRLLESGELNSDFAVGVCRKRLGGRALSPPARDVL